MRQLYSLFISGLLLASTSVGASAQDYPPPPGDKTPAQSLVEEFDSPLGAADIAAARPLPRSALELIKHFEGWRADAYNDPVGYCTIGFGHLIAKQRCENIDLGKFSELMSLPDGEKLLLSDTAGARVAVRKLVNVALSDEEFGSLASFVFNVGKGNFAKSTLLKRVNQGDRDSASKQFGRWINAKGVPFDGLIARRSCERTLFLGEEILTSSKLDRNKCETLGAASIEGQPVDIFVGE